jgi:hypothetical protein
MDLCKYRNALGKPGQGIHSFRIFNIAVVDVVLTFIGAYFISLATNIKYIYSLLGFFLLGIILHKLFCVPTTIDKLLFPGRND